MVTWLYLVIFLVSAYALGSYIYTYYESSKTLDEAQTIYETAVAKVETKTPQIASIRPQFTELLAVNPQIVGWVSVDGTKLHNPILQAADNDFYLNRNFRDEKSRAGSVFMDYRNDVGEPGRNTILYGHAMKNGTMFGSLHHYLQQDYADEHPIIYFDTLFEGYDVEVFAAYETTIDFYYIETELSDDTAFLNFINAIQARSAIEMDVEIEPEDQIITLSTCKNAILQDDNRFVVHGKLVKRSKK
ncbi:SrtB family sortase [Lysinibacillus piscis]|uniref:SrtB family sortase n=2 Tax=Lysinibacillus piscis TaxID=2518931 RepID=A0ABQ5NH54_9BACI|nr:SrtB family sortase [Lysinibacillus sp. KH24]